MLSPDSLKRLPELVITDQDNEFARCKFGALDVDVLLSDHPLFNLIEREHSTSHRFIEMDLTCATIDGLILMKMFALPPLYRQRRIQKAMLYEGDLAILYVSGRPVVDRFFAAVRPFVTDREFADLKQVLGDVQRMIARIDRLKQ